MKRDSFIFYRSFYEAIVLMPPEEQVKVYHAIATYCLNHKETELDGMAKMVFTLVKPQLDANYKRFENGCKGGKPKQVVTKPEPKANQTVTKSKANLNLNVNVNEYKENTLSGKLNQTATARQVIDHLNKTANRAYRHSKTSLEPIVARLKDMALDPCGLDKYPDINPYQWCEFVINRKVAKWGKDPKMSEFLRPETLFRRSNFESYLGEVLTSIKKSEEQYAKSIPK